MESHAVRRSKWMGLLLAGAVFGHGDEGAHTWRPAPYDEKLAHAPRPLPDRIVLTWAGDPASTQAVTWRTDVSVRRALAEIAVANENGRDLRPISVGARTERLASDLG